jgi:hypothetical protein
VNPPEGIEWACGNWLVFGTRRRALEGLSTNGIDDETGPKGPLRGGALVDALRYQLPSTGQPNEPPVVHVRVTAPLLAFAIVYTLPVIEVDWTT